MSDVRTGGPGPCPACDGDGRQTIGSLTLLCDECGGNGQVGGDPETVAGGNDYRMPEDGEEYDPDVHGPLPAFGGYTTWRSPS